MKRLLIIASLSLFPLNIFAAERVSFSKESNIAKNHQIEVKEVLKEIQDTCHNQNSLLRSALRILRTTLQKSTNGGSPSDLSDVKFSAKISLDGVDLGQLFIFKGSTIQATDFQTKPKWCVH